MQQTGKAIEKGFQNLKYKITGQKYHNNLLGESLEDMLRIATAKTLEAPDATVNQQIVETVNNEVASGKDPKEVVGLLKARLRMDNPQKQFLAVKLVEQIMTDCSAVLGSYQQELLVEVARVMTKPAKPETEAGKTARQAAKELLRKYGQEGTTAFRAVHNEGRARTSMQPPGASGYPPVGPAYGAYGGAYPPPGYSAQPPYGGYGVPGQPVYGAPHGAAHPGGINVETQSIIDEVRLLIDKARSNTELLSDMLVSTSGTPDDFETELVKDLATEVRELREVFNAYLEQMSAIEDPAMEQLLVQALEAVDMLDGALALQKDVALNQQEFAAAAAASRNDTSTTAAAAGGPTPAAAATAPQPAANNDLIALDDLADAMTATSIQGPAPGAATVPGVSGPSQPFDPFAASELVPILSSTVSAPPPGALGPAAAPAPSGPAPAGSSATGPSQPIPLDSLYGAPPAPQAYPQAPYGAPAYPGAGVPYPGSAPGQGPAAAYPGAAPAYPSPAAYPPQYPGAPPAPAYPGHSAAAYPGQPPAYGAAPGGLAPGVPPSPYAAPGAYPAPQAAAQYPPPPAGSFNNSSSAAKTSNPFQADPSGGMFLPGPPTGITGPANPFAAATPSAAPAAAPAPAPHAAAPIPPAGPSVDHEWELFFADRAAGATQAPRPA